MGRQTRFFMSKRDEAEFMVLVKDRNDVILDRTGCELTVKEIVDSNERKIFITLPQSGAIIKNSSGYINPTFSEVVEFIRCRREDDKHIENGRIWAEFRYYDSNGELVGKSKQFEDMYNYYSKWIRKHYKLNRDKDFYIAGDAYRRYKEEGYVMKSGVYVAEFD